MMLLQDVAHGREEADAAAGWGVFGLNKQDRSDYKNEKKRKRYEDRSERDFDDPDILLPVCEKLLIC